MPADYTVGRGTMQLAEIFNVARILTWFSFRLGQVVNLLYFFFPIAMQVYVGSGLALLPLRYMKVWIPIHAKWQNAYIYITSQLYSRHIVASSIKEG